MSERGCAGPNSANARSWRELPDQRPARDASSLQVLDGYPLLVLGQSRLVIDTDELGITPGEDFEIYLGGEQRPGHWFPLAPDARALIVRRTFSDWEHETSTELHIERLDAAPLAEPSSRFVRAAEYLDRMTELWTGSFLLRLKLVPTNSLRVVHLSFCNGAISEGRSRGGGPISLSL